MKPIGSPSRAIGRSPSASARRSGSACRRRSARACGSGSRWCTSTTTSRSACATKACVARDVGAAPICSTTSGRWASSHPLEASKGCPAPSAWPGRRTFDVGSAITGHPSRSARNVVDPGGVHVEPPTITTPRRPESARATPPPRRRTVRGSRRDAAGAPTGSPVGMSTRSGVSGSSKGQSMWTGPGVRPPQALSAARAARRHSCGCSSTAGTGGSKYARAYPP